MSAEKSCFFAHELEPFGESDTCGNETTLGERITREIIVKVRGGESLGSRIFWHSAFCPSTLKGQRLEIVNDVLWVWFIWER